MKNIAQLFRLIDEVFTGRPLALAVRLEAYYQHYARHTVMGGSLSQPLPRHAWWIQVVTQDPQFAARIVIEESLVLTDAEGAAL